MQSQVTSLIPLQPRGIGAGTRDIGPRNDSHPHPGQGYLSFGHARWLSSIVKIRSHRRLASAQSPLAACIAVTAP